jgi:hypothetical protein
VSPNKGRSRAGCRWRIPRWKLLRSALVAIRLAVSSAPLLIVGQLLVAIAAALPVVTAWLTKLLIDTLVGGGPGELWSGHTAGLALSRVRLLGRARFLRV